MKTVPKKVIDKLVQLHILACGGDSKLVTICHSQGIFESAVTVLNALGYDTSTLQKRIRDKEMMLKFGALR